MIASCDGLGEDMTFPSLVVVSLLLSRAGDMAGAETIDGCRDLGGWKGSVANFQRKEAVASSLIWTLNLCDVLQNFLVGLELLTLRYRLRWLSAQTLYMLGTWLARKKKKAHLFLTRRNENVKYQSTASNVFELHNGHIAVGHLQRYCALRFQRWKCSSNALIEMKW